jgi:organic radical activating enzyme
MINKPWRVTIDTNPDQCNLNCIMCDTHSIYNTDFKANRKYMDKELLERALEEVIELGINEIIPTTMGEPLIYKHFDTFISKISNSNVKLNLTTNGTFPNDSVQNWAYKLLPILSDVKISINSINHNINSKIMVKDDTNKKLENIKEFVKIRDEEYPNVSITLQVTFLNSNIKYLEELIQFAIEHNINRVKGHHLWITFNEIENESLKNNPYRINEWNKFIDKIDKYRDFIKLVNFDKLNIKDGKSYIPDNYICPFLNKELWIDHEGNYNICCAPSDLRKTLGDWGNINDINILELFNSNQYSKLSENYKNEAICQDCSLRILND